MLVLSTILGGSRVQSTEHSVCRERVTGVFMCGGGDGDGGGMMP